jgi:hypothetical protein
VLATAGRQRTLAEPREKEKRGKRDPEPGRESEERERGREGGMGERERGRDGGEGERERGRGGR